MLEIIPVTDIKINGIKLLRKFSPMSISAIKEAARYRLPVISVEEFSREWEFDRELLRDIATIYLDDGACIFTVQVRESEKALGKALVFLA